MQRIRTVKPELFKHWHLYQAEQESGLPLRIAYVGLFCCADREGRFKWRPEELKPDILPNDPCEFGAVLDALSAAGFVYRYDTAGESYGVIPAFTKHQAINVREAKSVLPPPPATCTHVHARGEGKGREGKGRSKPSGSSEDRGTSARARVEHGRNRPTPTGPASITLAMRKANITGAQPSNPRIVALADAGVTPDVVTDACDEAHRAHPTEAIPVAYVCTILERWLREPHHANGHPSASSAFDERAKDRRRTVEGLTGRSRKSRDAGEVIDVPTREIGHAAKHS
ncbi:hypothetical protein QFZ99_000868 [Paraburkholderia atlantica]|uniref:hypothetical protein n=1 Tax=Paraburkholderia atlantica TaxID=2654982 RepID=UPI003D232F5C